MLNYVIITEEVYSINNILCQLVILTAAVLLKELCHVILNILNGIIAERLTTITNHHVIT